jgi:hypothetical protein
VLSTLVLSVVAIAAASGCGASPGAGANEPALADSARSIEIGATERGELAPPCDRLVFGFRPTERGTYELSARSEVPVSLRLFATSPDLYVATGSRDGDVSRVSAELDADVEYAVTMTPRECRAAPYEVSLARR